MKTQYEQIVNVANIGKHVTNDMNPIFQLAQQEKLSSAVKDAPRRLILAIDVQNDFIEGGALEVPGSIGDVERATRFIYNNMEKITGIMCSLDTHTAYQIFHPCWWRNKNGDQPAPYTVITADDVATGKWRPIVFPADSLTYINALESLSKKQLCIWPYHCIRATTGQQLENEFAKIVHFHAVAKKATKNNMIPKGTDPLSEMYGIIKPEYSKKGYVNTPVLNAIEKYDEIYVIGEAASHCLMESVAQIADHFKNRPDVTQKITILKDCTSPIPGFEDATTAAFDNFKSTYGIKFAKSTDITF